MTTTIKTLLLAAFAGFASLVAPVAAQAQQLIYEDGPVSNGPTFIPVEGFYDEDFRPVRRYHHRQNNGFSFELQFGQQPVYRQRRQPGVIYHRRFPQQEQPVVQITRAHVQWCYNRYHTYDHNSNTFVIRHGQRAYCASPYSQ